MKYLNKINSFEIYPNELDNVERILSEVKYLLIQEKINFDKQVVNLPRRIDGDGEQFFMLEDILPILRYFKD